MKQSKTCILIVFWILVIYSTTLHATNLPVNIHKLKVEYTETPLGIDVEIPRFSWQMQSDVRGARQTAYQIVVTDELGSKVWDSGKVKSDISLNIKYDGTALKPTTRYTWQLTVWNEKNKQITSESWFETGLMNTDQSAWSGAKWIGGNDDDIVLYSHYLPVFRIDYSIQLDEQSKSTRAGFVFGANDKRMMDKNMNIFQLENGKDESYYMLEIDISPLASKEDALLNLYRVGFHPEDKKNQPFKSFPIPSELVNNDNKYQKHAISITNDMGHACIFVNKQEIGKSGINPLGQGGDFIAFPVVGDIGFVVPENQTAVFSDVEIRNFRNPSNILVKETGETVSGGEAGVFVTHDPSRNAMPMLRSGFHLRNEIAKARLYVTSRGIYEYYINGKRVGDDYFNPGATQYDKTHMYQTFDVTDMLQSGDNAMGAILAEGWWSGGATFSGNNWNFFGDRQSLLSKMVITYADWKEEVIVSDPDTWQYFNDGPVVYGSFFQGEIYDASKDTQVEGWSTTSYNTSKWEKAQEVPLTGTIRFQETDYLAMQLTGQYGQTVKQIKELTAQSVEEVRPGVYVYDMGQNMVGVPKISLEGMKPGKEITLRFAEVKYPDMPEYQQNAGMIMLENIRAAMAQDIYMTKGGIESIQPRFTFHGYRFIEITGIDKALPLQDVKGIVISSIHEPASSYETSNAKVNKLWENITWSTYGNFLSIPTDCPQRNERMGWSGDISVFSRAATYLADIPQFLKRHMLAMRDVQREDGRFPDIAPLGGGFGGILWGSAGITVAWESYLQYEDTELLTEHYDAMKKYIAYLVQQIDPQSNIMGTKFRSNWGSLGDWLSPEYEKSEKSLMWEAYFIYDLELMKKIATILNKDEDARYFDRLYSERKDFFNRTYIDNKTGKTIYPDAEKIVDTQVSYVLPLAFNIFNEENKEKALTNFKSTVTRTTKADIGTECPAYSLMTGFVGTAWINKALSDNGLTDVAYRLLQQTSYPSWLYSVEQGATTIWERLNSYTHTDGFGGNNRMNSFNHYSFGAVASWMYNYSLGIERDENSPGFKHFLLKPEADPTGEMTFAKGYYDSMYGCIESGWEYKNGTYYYTFAIPANTSATLFLKASSPDQITDEGIKLSKVKNVTYIGMKDGKCIFNLPSGKYSIEVKE